MAGRALSGSVLDETTEEKKERGGGMNGRYFNETALKQVFISVIRLAVGTLKWLNTSLLNGTESTL